MAIMRVSNFLRDLRLFNLTTYTLCIYISQSTEILLRYKQDTRYKIQDTNKQYNSIPR
ncbi:hypothetical protein WN48_04518 [Eufriesea mexicana]|nr:hypothetical protein WN48_04518 [Eufriesea mexicana]